MTKPSLLSFFNPLSGQHQAVKEFGKIKGWQKVLTGTVTALVTLVALPIVGLGIFCGIATFRALTEKFTAKVIQPAAGSPADKTHQVSKEIFPPTLNTPPSVAPVQSKPKPLYVTPPIQLSSAEKLKVAETKTSIQQIFKYAQLVESLVPSVANNKLTILGSTDYINPKAIGYHPFLFDQPKWELLLTELERDPMMVCREVIGINTPNDTALALEALKEECRLDLVEALAELNIAPNPPYKKASEFSQRPISHLNPERVKSQCTNVQFSELTAIVDQAKKTVKGDVFLMPDYIGVMQDQSHLLLKPKDPKNDPLMGLSVSTWMTNPENDNWSSHYYARHIGGGRIHCGGLIGNKEGSRIVIDAQNNQGDTKLILRCAQKSYRYGNRFGKLSNFEDLLGRLTLHMPTKHKELLGGYPNLDQQKRAATELLTKIFGEEKVREWASAPLTQ